MTNKYKKEIEEMNRRIYSKKSLAALKIIGKKKKGLLNVDQYTKANKNKLVERLVKGKQLSDESKDVLLEIGQFMNLKVNASMSKKVILQKITKPKLTDYTKKGLIKLAEKDCVPLRSQMTEKAIIQRLENPTNYYTVKSLTRCADRHGLKLRSNMSRQEIINFLEERNLITTTPITAQESNLGVLASNVPIELIRKATKKTQSAREALINFKEYIKNIKRYISADRLKKLTKQLERKEKKAKEEQDRIFTPTIEASAFKNYTTQYVMYNTVANYPPLEFLSDARPAIINIFNSNRNIKTILYLHCLMSRMETGGGLIIKKFAFHSKGQKLILEGTDEEEVYDEMVGEIEEEIQKVGDAVGSGWQFVEVEKLVLHTTRWEPSNGSSYIDLPEALKNKKAIINMKNQDEECFKWCALRALYPKDKNAERVDKDLKSKQDTLNMKGIRYPVNFRDIDRFESQNPEISITILGYNKDERVYPLKISRYTGCKHDITLLLIKDGEKSHYCFVKKLSALLQSQINNHKGIRNICLNCFNGFNTPDSLNKHKEYCYNNECFKIVMPPPGTYLRFKNFLHSEKVPFVIYADFECLIKPMDNCNPYPNKSYTKKYQKHEPISFSYYIECFDNSLCKQIFNDDTKRKQLKSYTKTKPEDEDAMDVFIKWLEEDVKAIANIE